MSVDQAIAFVLFAVVAAGTPGPSNILLTSTGVIVGVRGGLPCLFGVTVGMGVMMALVTVGLGGLVLDHPAIVRVLKWGGIALLFWLSWKIATAGRGQAEVSERIVGFWEAASFQWVNPKSWLISASAVSAYLQPDANVMVQSLVLGVLFTAAALPGCFIWLAFGAGVQRVLRTERAARRFNVAMGILLACSIVLLVR